MKTLVGTIAALALCIGCGAGNKSDVDSRIKALEDDVAALKKLAQQQGEINQHTASVATDHNAMFKQILAKLKDVK